MLRGGYISWFDPISRHWMQLRMFQDELSKKVPHVVDLNNETVFGSLLATMSVRSAIDAVTKPPKAQTRVKGLALRAINTARTATEHSSSARAAAIRDQLERVRTQATAVAVATKAQRKSTDKRSR